MVFQVGFKGRYHTIRLRLENALVVCDWYSLYLYFGYF